MLELLQAFGIIAIGICIVLLIIVIKLIRAIFEIRDNTAETAKNLKDIKSQLYEITMISYESQCHPSKDDESLKF